MHICSECGQKVRKLNPHRMCRAKLAMLVLLDRADRIGAQWVKVGHGKEIEVEGTQYSAPYRAEAHVSRLVWFGLAERGTKRSGLYRITNAGRLFLRGRATVPEIIYCKDGEVVRASESRVLVTAIKGVVLDKAYWDNYATEQVAA